MPIQRMPRRFLVARIETVARRLLGASTLCAIATTSPTGRAHISTAYFAWGRSYELVWISSPAAQHSRNLRSNPRTAIAVYDSAQTWGKPDRGIQLFGQAREPAGNAVDGAAQLYSHRFPQFRAADFRSLRFYRFVPNRLKLFHEPVLGGGVFVTCKVGPEGRLSWERTELYR